MGYETAADKYPHSCNNNHLASTTSGTSNTKGMAPKRLGSQQTFLDLGQRSYGKRTLCLECGMLYVNGEDEDEKQHAAYCRGIKRGLVFPGWKNERYAQRIYCGRKEM